jgi:hypothetical protein
MNDMYEVLKSYVLSLDKPPLLLKNVFSNSVSELIVTFLECQSEMIHATICAIEGEKVTLAEAKSIIESLLEKLHQRRDNDFATRKGQSLLEVLIQDGLITEKNYGNYKNEFYNTCTEYIQEWFSDTLTFESLSWILMKNPEASSLLLSSSNMHCKYLYMCVQQQTGLNMRMSQNSISKRILVL